MSIENTLSPGQVVRRQKSMGQLNDGRRRNTGNLTLGGCLICGECVAEFQCLLVAIQDAFSVVAEEKGFENVAGNASTVPLHLAVVPMLCLQLWQQVSGDYAQMSPHFSSLPETIITQTGWPQHHSAALGQPCFPRVAAIVVCGKFRGVRASARVHTAQLCRPSVLLLRSRSRMRGSARITSGSSPLEEYFPEGTPYS